MNIYEENLDFLKNSAKALYNIIMEDSPVFDYKATYLQEEDNFFIESGNAACYMHSLYSKENEIEMMFQNMPEDTEVVILFGVGCGHAIDYLMNKTGKVRYVVMVEPMLPVFKFFIKKYRLRDMSKIGKFTCIVNSKCEMAYNVMQQALMGELGSKVFFASHIGYRTIFMEYYDSLQDNIFRLMRNARTNITVQYLDYKLKTYNFISNLKIDALQVECLKELIKGHPIVIVSAGASLNKNINYLNSIKSKAIVIAVGSAIKILDSHGIIPHFRMAYDWTQGRKSIFDDLENTRVPLIFTDQLFCRILPEYDGIKFRTVSASDIIPIQIMKNANIDYDLNHAGNSIANVALGMLCRMGCSHVVFVGQDMCFIDNNLYAEGRSQITAKGYEKNLMEVKDIYGNKAYSIITYVQIKYQLEEIIKLYPNVQFINATEGGLGIDGTENMPLTEVIDKVLVEDLAVDVESFVKGIYSLEAMDSYSKQIEKGAKILYCQVNEILADCTEVLDIYIKIKQEKDRGNSLEKIDEYGKQLEDIKRRIENQELYLKVVSKGIGAILNSLSYKKKNSNKERDKETDYTDYDNYFYKKVSSIMEYCLLLKERVEVEFKIQIDSINDNIDTLKEHENELV